MLPNRNILPKKLTLRVRRFYGLIIKFLGSNIALAIIAVPNIQPNYVNIAQADLIIPETKLEASFNIPSSPESEAQIPVDYSYVSQGFRSFHPGMDLVTKFGTPIRPIATGDVEEAGYSPFGYGNAILVNHGDGTKSLYAHLSKIYVKKGDTVTLNTVIGLVGSTGRSTGPHLHLEIYQDNVPINPLTMLPDLTKKAPTLLTNTKLTSNQQ